MALEVGSAYSRVGARFDSDGFDRWERRLRSARHDASDPVNVDLGADVHTRGFDDYNRKVDDVNRRHDDLVRGSGRVRTSLGTLFVGGAGFAAAGAAVVGLARGVGAVTDAYEESAKVGAQTNAVLKSTGGVAGVSAKQVSDLATALSEKTGIDDEAIQSGENLLLTFTNVRNEAGKGNDVFNQATSILTDMSAALGQDTSSSAIQLGKALNDPIKGVTALQRVGVSFTAQQRDQIKTLVESGKTVDAQKLILRELNREFGGTAEATATGTGKMRVALGNLAEFIGGKLNPYITKAAGYVTGLVDSFINGTGTAGKFGAILKQVLGVVGGLITSLVAAGRAVIEFLRTNDDVQRIVGQIRRTFTALGAFLVKVFNDARRVFRDVLPDLKAIGTAALSIFRRLEDLIQPVVRSVLPGLERAFKGVFEVIRGVVRLIAGIFTGDWHKAWQGFKQIAKGGIDLVHGVITGAVGIFKTAGGKLLGAVGDGIKGAIGGVLSIGRGFVNKIIDVINVLPGVNIGHVGGGGSGDLHSPAAQVLSGAARPIGGFPGHYAGGVVTSPMAIVGEEAPEHPEVIIPSNPAYRGRAVALWQEAGRMIGIPGFALGGILKGIGSTAASVGRTVVHSAEGLGGALIDRLPDNPFTGPFTGLGSSVLGKVGGFIKSKVGAAWRTLTSPFRGADTPGGPAGGGGTVTFDGRPVAAWIAPVLAWARAHGWGGGVTSGFRNPAQQMAAAVGYGLEHYGPGGPLASNHTRTAYPGGAVDVSDPAGLAAVLRGYHGSRPLVWGGPVIGDVVHFSATGHARGGIRGLGATGIPLGRAALGALRLPGFRKGGKLKRRPVQMPTGRWMVNRGIKRSIARGEHGIAGYETTIQDLERSYSQKDREYGLSDEVILVEHDDGSVTVDQAALDKRVGELGALYDLRQKIADTIRKYRDAVLAMIDKYKAAITKLKAMLSWATGKGATKIRAGYKAQIGTYQDRIGELQDVAHDLGFDLEDSRIDLEELAGEISAAKDQAATGAKPASDVLGGGDASDRPGPVAPTADAQAIIDQANQRAASLAADLAAARQTITAFGGPGDLGAGGFNAFGAGTAAAPVGAGMFAGAVGAGAGAAVAPQITIELHSFLPPTGQQQQQLAGVVVGALGAQGYAPAYESRVG